MAGTFAPPVPHCRDLTPVGERLASTLYTAHSDRIGYPVTVTVYPPLAGEDAWRRFDDAAAGARRLAAHPSVLTIHDWGQGDDSRPWVVTDPQPPETIDTLLRTEGPLPIEQALRIGVLVAGALETAHRAGVVHGDLSPARLVLGPQGEPLVADIGLAEFSDFPGFGALHNPIRYFAPPEVLERTGVSPASDVYSLATTVYALLAGAAPHEKPADVTDSNASLLLRILQIEVPPIVRPGEDIGGVEAALIPALAHAAERRPHRVVDLAWSLQDVQRHLGFAVVEPVVLDLGDPEHQSPESAATEPEAAPRPAPGDSDALATWSGEPQPDPAGASDAGLVHLFSDTPPDFTARPRDATARRWATGLGHPGGSAPAAGHDDPPAGVRPHRPAEPRRSMEPGRPRRPDQPRRPAEPRRPMEPDQPHDPYPPDEPHPPAAATGDTPVPANRFRPNGHTRAPFIDAPTAGLNGRGNGLRQVPPARNDRESGPVPGPQTARSPAAVPPIVARGRPRGGPATRSGPSTDAGGRTPLDGSDAAAPGAVPAAGRTRTGSALERARQARMRRYAATATGQADPDTHAAPSVRAPVTAAGGAPAAPVIVLIVVVVLLTLGVAYMVITGDGTTDPVDEQPGASTPSAPVSMNQA
jgi:serine/threonine protein kinase